MIRELADAVGALLKFKIQNSKCKIVGALRRAQKEMSRKDCKKSTNEVSKVIKTYKPDALAIEELFFNTNAKTAFVVGEARGVILLAAAENNLEIAIYTPLQVKMALTGYGRAEKSQIGKMVKTLLALKEMPKPDDTADALAIALTYAFSNKLAKLAK